MIELGAPVSAGRCDAFIRMAIFMLNDHMVYGWRLSVFLGFFVPLGSDWLSFVVTPPPTSVLLIPPPPGGSGESIDG